MLGFLFSDLFSRVPSGRLENSVVLVGSRNIQMRIALLEKMSKTKRETLKRANEEVVAGREITGPTLFYTTRNCTRAYTSLVSNEFPLS